MMSTVDQAIPIRVFLGLSENEYKTKYCPVVVEETDIIMSLYI